MATTGAWRDDPAVVVFLIGPETRHPDEAAEAERPRRGFIQEGGEQRNSCPCLRRSRSATQLVVWFAGPRGCEHSCTLSLLLVL